MHAAGFLVRRPFFAPVPWGTPHGQKICDGPDRDGGDGRTHPDQTRRRVMKTELQNTDCCELTDSVLDSVVGGMKMDGVRESTNVIDARGGSSTVGTYIVYYDKSGKVSGYGMR
jgi:hypothetical protein